MPRTAGRFRLWPMETANENIEQDTNMSAVELNITEFRATYPAFLDENVYTDATITSFFNQAVELIGNTDTTSVVPYNPTATPPVTNRKAVLYATTCHLITLLGGTNATSPNGAIASASEGSVSTSFQLLSSQSQSAQWWNLTRCGALAYMMMRKYMLGGRLYSHKDYHPYG